MDPHEHLRADSPLMNMSSSFLRDGMLSLSIPGPSRDPVYYISDGNSVVLVENTLFRVHRSSLTKDKSAFETMFQLSSETDSSRSDSSMTVTPEGENDDNPIRLQGDTADEFRALLWSLYALPHELFAATTPEANTMQLLNLARITHKYQFRSIENWAVGALCTFYSRPGAFDDIPTADPEPLPLSHVTTPPASPSTRPSLVQITEVAALCECADLLEAAIPRWKRLIGENKDLALAAAIGERFSLRAIAGLAYHALMLRGRAHWEADALLTREQRVRLLCGYYACTKLGDALSAQPPLLTHNARCASNARCTKAWGVLWKNVAEIGSQFPLGMMERENILGRVMLAESMVKAMVEKEIPSQGFMDGMPHCRESALIATTMKVREIREMLPDLFSDDL